MLSEEILACLWLVTCKQPLILSFYVFSLPFTFIALFNRERYLVSLTEEGGMFEGHILQSPLSGVTRRRQRGPGVADALGGDKRATASSVACHIHASNILSPHCDFPVFSYHIHNSQNTIKIQKRHSAITLLCMF